MQHISRRKPFRLELIKAPDNIKRRHKPVGRNKPPGAEGLPEENQTGGAYPVERLTGFLLCHYFTRDLMNCPVKAVSSGTLISLKALRKFTYSFSCSTAGTAV